MAKVVLISPTDQFTLGVRSLSATLKKAGHTCRIIILNTIHHNRNPENLRVDSGYSGANASCSEIEYGLLLDLIRESDPDFIGLSLASQCFGLCAWLTGRFHRDLKEIPVLWGGVDPTLHPELGIQHADYLATGEAEDSLLDLIETIASGNDATKVEGFWARRGETIYRNPMRPLIQDLDRLPFPDYERGEKFLIEFDHVSSLEKLWYINMTQRGCPYRCTFCVNSALPSLSPGQKYVRRRSPLKVIEELVRIKVQYPGELDFIWFWDDIFTINRKWLREFAPIYRDKVGLPFCCYTYPGQCDDEIATLLKAMGVAYVHFGVESGSKRVLNEIYGRSDPAGVVETAETLRRHYIPYRVDLIAANPLETDEDHFETLEILLKCPHPFRVNPTNPLAFYFNSPITRLAKEKGVALREVEGVNGYLAEDDNNFPFWKAIFDLAQYSILDDDFVRSLARDEHLKKHPEVVINFQKTLQNTHWSDPTAFVSKQDIVDVLTQENRNLKERLGSIEVNPLYRIYKKFNSSFLNGPQPTKVDSAQSKTADSY